MSTNETPPGTTEPTIEQVQQIGMAGAQAVKPEEQTQDEARTAVATAVQEKAQELRVTLDPAAVDMIANATIGKLDAMGAFRKPEPPAENNAEGEGTEQSEQVAAEPPAKKTLAQKLLG